MFLAYYETLVGVGAGVGAGMGARMGAGMGAEANFIICL